jgi:hypothetical protein
LKAISIFREGSLPQIQPSEGALGGNNLYQRGNKRQPDEVTEADVLIASLE